jgi:hypothetical protein
VHRRLGKPSSWVELDCCKIDKVEVHSSNLFRTLGKPSSWAEHLHRSHGTWALPA